MKRKILFKILILTLLLCSIVCLTACGEETPQLTDISVTGQTETFIDEFNFADYIITATYDNGITQHITLSAEHLSSEDILKLETVGTHILTVNYYNKSATFILTLKNHDFEGVTFANKTVSYDGNAKTIEVSGLPHGANVTYSPTNSYTNAGTYQVTATVTKDNYNILTITATLKIQKVYKITFRQKDCEDIIKEVVEGESLSKQEIPIPQEVKGYEVYWQTEEFSNVNTDIIVEAQTIIKEYEITYDVGDGQNSTMNPLKYTCLDDDIELLPLEKSPSGYHFKEWQINGETVTKISTSSCENLVVTATYNAIFVLDENNFIRGLTEYGKTLKKLIIPDKIDGKSTGNVYSNVYRNNRILEEVEIEEGIWQIASYAFAGCNMLQKVTLPSSLKEIYSGAFSNTGIKTITIPENTYMIWNDAFRSCALENITFLCEGVNFGTYVFAECSKLKSVELPCKQKKLPAGLFYGAGLENIVIPNTVEKIDAYSLYAENVNFLGMADEWAQISNSFAPDGFYEDNVYFKYNLYINNEPLTEVTLNCNKINNRSFSGVKNIKKVVFGDGVEEIGRSAFYHCESLTEVIMGNSVKSLGKGCFKRCESLEAITISNAIESIGDSCFEDCLKIKYYEKEGAYYIGNEDNNYLVLMDSENKGIYSWTIIENGTKIIYSVGIVFQIYIPKTVQLVVGGAFSNVTTESLRVYYESHYWDYQAIEIGDNNSKLTNAIITYEVV